MDLRVNKASSTEGMTIIRRHIDHQTLLKILNIHVVSEQSLESADATTQATPSGVSGGPSSSSSTSQRPVRQPTGVDKLGRKVYRTPVPAPTQSDDGCEYVYADGHVEAVPSKPEKRVLRDRQRPATALEAEDNDSEESDSESVEQQDHGNIYSPFNAQIFPETAVWPIKAYIRFFQSITQLPFFTKCAYPFARRCYLQQIHQKMLSFRTDEKILPQSLVHPDDHDKLDAADGEVVYVRPVYDTRPTLNDVRKQFRYFYNTDHIDKPLEGPHRAPGNFRKLAKRIRPAVQPTSTLSRSRRTGRHNPLVEAIIEEKKQHKRSTH